MKKFFVMALTFFCLACLVSCDSTKLAIKTLTITKQDDSTIFVQAEIADTEKTRAKGFMERTEIPDGTGMLFVFQQDQILSFWMKNTPSPLSIAYIDSRGKIRDIFDMTPFSLLPIKSTVSVRYALEVPQGWFEKVGICIGDTLDVKAFSNSKY